MASIHEEIVIDAPAEHVWDAIRDVGALHTRLVPGFVTDTKMEEAGAVRAVTFANGSTVRERIVTVDDKRRRLVWSVVSEPFSHHNGSIQAFAEGDRRTKAVWIADLLPEELAPRVQPMMAQGLKAMKAALERSSAGG
ncbi:MAG: SRPBCC family protein [Polyangiaceae bacterium]|nr:SRPBCC family protein [Polyangiaceae bacterium]